MKKSRIKIIKSFRDAVKGIIYIFMTQRNFRIQAICFLLVLFAALLLQLSLSETAIVVFAGGMVLVGEMVNTGLEKLVDLIKPDYHPLVRTIKDISAGVVLISSFLAVIIGVIIFLPKIIELF
ncbi:MAG: diacylglycerol kinase family protein [Clostridia bacterium]